MEISKYIHEMKIDTYWHFVDERTERCAIIRDNQSEVVVG